MRNSIFFKSANAVLLVMFLLSSIPYASAAPAANANPVAQNRTYITAPADGSGSSWDKDRNTLKTLTASLRNTNDQIKIKQTKLTGGAAVAATELDKNITTERGQAKTYIAERTKLIKHIEESLAQTTFANQAEADAYKKVLTEENGEFNKQLADFQGQDGTFDGNVASYNQKFKTNEQPGLQPGAAGGGTAPGTTGSSEKGLLSKSGDFLKKNGAGLALGALAGGGIAWWLNKKDDDKEKEREREKEQAATAGGAAGPAPASEAPTAATKTDAPTDNTAQTGQTTTAPTEQSNPVAAEATVTANDPAYTGKGSAEGATGDDRDQGAGDYTTSFACGASESETQCRARYACTATESLGECETRWNSGLVKTTD